MFGYITIQKKSLTEQEWNSYRSYYCGVCRSLRQRFGAPARLLLSYDLAFLALLLTALDEDDDSDLLGTQRCPLHPLRQTATIYNEYCDYAADMTLLLAYHKCRDQWQDEKSLLSRAEMRLLQRSVDEVSRRRPRQAQAVADYMAAQWDAEQREETDIDAVAALSGTMLSELFAVAPLWQEQLRGFAFQLGKFIYLMDAYEDVDKDIRKNNYNPLRTLRRSCSVSEFEAQCEALLTDTLAAGAEYFERLPIVLHGDLLRNIIYAGVWGRFEVIHRHRMNKSEKTGK